MGSVVNYDERCYNCGEYSMFHDFCYRTGELYESCSACGYTYSFYYPNETERRKLFDQYRIPLNRIYIRIRQYNSAEIVQRTPLPSAITQQDLEQLGWQGHEKQLQILQKYGIPTDNIPSDSTVELVYHLKRKKDVFERMNYIGNSFEITKDRNPQTILFRRCKAVRREQKSYGAMYIAFPGKREPYFRAFHKKPNLDKVLRKWDRIAGEHYDTGHSYLSVIENGKATYSKGHYPDDGIQDDDIENKDLALSDADILEPLEFEEIKEESEEKVYKLE